MFGVRPRLWGRNPGAGDSALPGARRVSAPGCWAIGGAEKRDTDSGGGVCDRDRVTDCTLHHDRNSQGLQVRWSGAADERHPV